MLLEYFYRGLICLINFVSSHFFKRGGSIFFKHTNYSKMNTMLFLTYKIGKWMPDVHEIKIDI